MFIKEGLALWIIFLSILTDARVASTNGQNNQVPSLQARAAYPRPFDYEPKNQPVVENLQYKNHPLPKLSPFWDKEVLPAAESLELIQAGYDKFLPMLEACHDQMEKESELEKAIEHLAEVQKSFTELVTQFGPTCDGPVKPGGKGLMAFQRSFVSVFLQLQKNILVLKTKWPKTYNSVSPEMFRKFSNGLQVLISLGLNLKIDVNCIFDFLSLRVFSSVNIDLVGLSLLSRKVNATLQSRRV